LTEAPHVVKPVPAPFSSIPGGREIRGVLFDIDDTLVDTRVAFRHALERIAALHLPQPQSPDVLGAFWRADRHGHYRAFTRGEIDYRAQRMLRANDLHAQFGGPEMSDDDYDVWNADFELFFREGWRPHADAAAALDALDAIGVPYGALSNAAHAYQEEKLAACGLERMPVLVGVDTLGFGKPDPRVFALACERLGVPARHVAYVGDELDIDATAAVAAGLALGVWLDRSTEANRTGAPASGNLPSRVARVASLDELPAVLHET